MPLPQLPAKKVINVEKEPEGLEGIELCADCKKLTRYWKGVDNLLCPECADNRRLKGVKDDCR